MLRRLRFTSVVTAKTTIEIFTGSNVTATCLFAPQNINMEHTEYALFVRGVVGVTGFEPATSWSQTTRSTKLSYTPPR